MDFFLIRFEFLFIIGRQVDGIWHTAVVVFGREYFYGSHGISAVPPVSFLFDLFCVKILFNRIALYTHAFTSLVD